MFPYINKYNTSRTFLKSLQQKECNIKAYIALNNFPGHHIVWTLSDQPFFTNNVYEYVKIGLILPKNVTKKDIN